MITAVCAMVLGVGVLSRASWPTLVGAVIAITADSIILSAWSTSCMLARDHTVWGSR